ncbi:MAG TPA: gamma-glutamylcyclotransferase family protein [Candidatus Binatia bacterium]|nr:gamma-glutamylcyclotransferase family protein [Candidatus Binatia bacterium]
MYGTLMRGFPLHPVLAGGAEFVDRATVPARLIDLGRYPGAVPDERATVRGELYRITDPSLWARLDSAEGPQYHRRETRVHLAGSGEAIAHVYWFVGPLDRGVPIPDGDYRTHAPARSIHLLQD